MKSVFELLNFDPNKTAGAVNVDGVPYLLARDPNMKAPSKAKKQTSAPSPKVYEDLLKLKTPDTVVAGEELASKIRGPKSEGQPQMLESSQDPREALKNDYYTFMQKRMGRQNELDQDYDELKATERPSGFPTLDLTPAFAMVDNFTGSNLTKSYKAPTLAKEYDAKLKDAKELSLANADKLSADQFAMVGLDDKSDQFMENQDRDDARLDKTLKNAIEVARINANARMNTPGMNPNLLYRMQRDFQTDLKDFAKEMTPQAEFASSIDSVLTQISLKPDLPGLGWDKANPLGWVSDRAFSDNGELKRSVQKVSDSYRKVISGTAASDSERAALDYLSGNTKSITKEGLANAMNILQQGVNARNKSISAGYNPKVVQTYENRGGMKTQSSSTPVGTIEDGYKFVGGNDQDPKNWVKVK